MISISAALDIAMALTVVGLVAASIRLILGPTRADRVVALDLITVLLVSIAAQLSLLYKEAAYLDLGLAIALVGFLATVAFARYIERAPGSSTIANSDALASERDSPDQEYDDMSSTSKGSTT
ncbi:MAG: cation:proton antiporter [Granulosicoccus sp.]